MKICLFGSASTKIDEEYIKLTEEIGSTLAKRQHELVFGAGANGLMGAAARGVKSAGGKVTGVIPEFFREEQIEKIFDSCDEIIFTESMSDRKKKMEELADAFIIVPGGIGTFEEFFEVLTLKQLGRHDKPIAIYNINGFYDRLEAFVFNCANEKFIRSAVRQLYMYFSDIDELFSYIENDKGTGLKVHEMKDG